MAKFFLDTKFAESMRKPIWWLPTIGSFNKPKWGIELISIGIVCEDGREYYAVSEEFNILHCNDWVVKNVLTKLPRKYTYEFNEEGDGFPDYTLAIQKKNDAYKSLECIKDDVALFFGCGIGDNGNYEAPEGIELRGHYSAHGYVLLCSLFGEMSNLPSGFPKHIIELSIKI